MRPTRRWSGSYRMAALITAALMGWLGATVAAGAQDLEILRTPDVRLVLQAQGSFFVGGDTVDQTEVELGSFGPPGRITVNQMYGQDTGR